MLASLAWHAMGDSAVRLALTLLVRTWGSRLMRRSNLLPSSKSVAHKVFSVWLYTVWDLTSRGHPLDWQRPPRSAQVTSLVEAVWCVFAQMPLSSVEPVSAQDSFQEKANARFQFFVEKKSRAARCSLHGLTKLIPSTYYGMSRGANSEQSIMRCPG